MKTVVGIEVVSYTNKSQKLIQGIRLHITEDLVSPNLGVRTFSEFVSGANVKEYKLGEISAVLYEPGYGNMYRCTGVIYK